MFVNMHTLANLVKWSLSPCIPALKAALLLQKPALLPLVIVFFVVQDPRDRVHDEHVVGEDMLDFLHAFMEGTPPLYRKPMLA